MQVMFGAHDDIDSWMELVNHVKWNFPGLETALGELNREKDITVSTFREDDEKGVAPRALYKKYGFVEGELTMEFDYPNQIFVLKPYQKRLI